MKFLKILFAVLFCLAIVGDFENFYTKAAAINCKDDSTQTINDTKANENPSSDNKNVSEVSTTKAESDTSTKAPEVVTTDEFSEVKQFFQTIQKTIEKTKPWMEEIGKETKRLEVSVKRISDGFIGTLNDFVDRLIGNNDAGNNGAVSLFNGLLGGTGSGPGAVHVVSQTTRVVEHTSESPMTNEIEINK
ncbi:uncharacterized protein LOC119671162 [Teleopsis dalmanni]|uniref:uncharacterized protein LOC119671162 n=1 Tax=Teleopsis dalmanni TaxID=139649 RepID=UPI0018CE90D0|nr:uncharacterized protein LOC119671162 [Teleopsis dalmanni]